jgi:hypothetical protein
MFNYISAHKNTYHKGQIFPFMLAVVVVLIIMFMMTINLGQMSVYKTDTSNAADAGALAGASIITGAILGLGMVNDSMCVEAIIFFAGAVVACCCWHFAAAAALLIMHTLNSINTYVQQKGQSIAALGQARKAAVQYAWQNISVDEPRPSLKSYIDCQRGQDGYPNCALIPETISGSFVHACSTAELSKYQSIYETGYDISVKQNLDAHDQYGNQIKIPDEKPNTTSKCLKNGFSQFMSDDVQGWWCYGEPSFTSIPPATLVSAFAWNNNGDIMDPSSTSNKTVGADSYVVGLYSPDVKSQPTVAMNIEGRGLGSPQFDNVVEVKVAGPVSYDFELFTPIGDITVSLTSCLTKLFTDLFDKYLPDILKWVLGVLSDIFNELMGVITGLISGFMPIYPTGLQITGERDQLVDNPIEVTVTRWRRSPHMGIWQMQYNSTPGDSTAGISSTASAGLVDDLSIQTDCQYCVSSQTGFSFYCFHSNGGGTSLSAEDKLKGKQCTTVSQDPLMILLCDCIRALINDDSSKLTNAFKTTNHLYEARLLNTR